MLNQLGIIKVLCIYCAILLTSSTVMAQGNFLSALGTSKTTGLNVISSIGEPFLGISKADNIFVMGGNLNQISSIFVGTESIGEVSYPQYELFQNFPNPFNPITKIQFAISKSEMVVLKIFDIAGNELGTLVNEYKVPGVYTVYFNGAKLSSGVYFYRISAGNYTAVKKLIVLK